MVERRESVDRLRVLVVDDYQPMRIILRSLLRELGVEEIAEASDGEQALEVMQDFPPDIIFTDHRMEPMDGIELTRRIRAGEGGNRFVPIVMVTAFTEKETVTQARDAGITEFLAKPVSAKMVLLRLNAVIEKPRPFVETSDFFGPDRRRRPLPVPRSKDRRERPYSYEGPTRERPRDGERVVQ